MNHQQICWGEGMRRILLGLILMGLLAGSVGAETYVVCVRQFTKNLGNINATDSRGRSVEGTVTQTCVECLGDAIILQRPAEQNPSAICGSYGMKYVEFNTPAEAQAFFRSRCNRCW
jgi:hypothetical protein